MVMGDKLDSTKSMLNGRQSYVMERALCAFQRPM
jgi:hypothetical protein